jgi:hypothetical protein
MADCFGIDRRRRAKRDPRLSVEPYLTAPAPSV